MGEINLRFDSEEDLVFPVALLSSKLTCAEIVTVLCFMAMQQSPRFLEDLTDRLITPDVRDASAPLREKGVLKATLNDTKLSIEIDLDAALTT